MASSEKLAPRLKPWAERYGALAMAGLSRITIAIWLFVLLVLAAIVLNFLAKPTVEFSLYAQSEGFSFVTRKAMSTKATKLGSGEVLAVRRVAVDEQPLPITGGSRVRVAGAGGDLTLSDVSLAKGWTVSIQAQDKGHLVLNASPSQSAASGARAAVTFVAGAGSTLAYIDEAGNEKTMALPENAQIAIEADTLSIDIEADSAKILNSVEISDLSLTRDAVTIDESGVENISVEGTVASGKLWREYAAGETELGPLDQLSATAVEGGILRNVVWRDGTIGLAAHGNAGALTNSIGESPRDLRPSMLAVLRDLGLLQAILAIFTFVGGLELTAFVGRRK